MKAVMAKAVAFLFFQFRYVQSEKLNDRMAIDRRIQRC